MRDKTYPELAIILIAAILILLAGIWIAFDGKQYWHEVRFLYLTSQFSYSEILSGTFNPQQAWTTSNEVSSSGFYLSKMGHMLLLKSLFLYFPADSGGFEIAVVVSVVLMLATSILVLYFYDRLLDSRWLAYLAFICLWITPLTPYLAGKILSENTSIFLVVLSLFTISFATEDNRNKIYFAIAAGTFIALAASMRIDSLFGIIGALVAYLIFPITIRGHYVRIPMIVLAAVVFVLLYSSLLLAANVDALNLIDYFSAFIDAPRKPVLMSVQGIVTAGGAVYLVLILGLFSKTGRVTRFLSVWLVVTALPALLISWNFMIEPRYLVQATIPLCGLGALGMEKLFILVDWRNRTVIAAGAMIFIILVAANYLLVKLMPYELDRPAIIKAVNEIKRIDKTASILIPWSYSDYHFLRVVLNDNNIFNVNAPTDSGLDADLKLFWEQRFNLWYGSQYISEPAQLDKLLKSGPVYYLGWKAYPPIQIVYDFAAFHGIRKLTTAIENLQLKDHREESWIWNLSDYEMRLTGRSGQYEYYTVK